MTGRRLHVYGDEAKFRDALRRNIKRSDELIEQLDAARSIIESIPPNTAGLHVYLLQHSVLEEFQPAFARWTRSNSSLLRKYLGSATTSYLQQGWRYPRDDDAIAIADQYLHHIQYSKSELERVLNKVPPVRSVERKTNEDRFIELRNSALIEETVLNSYVRRMSRLNTKAGISDTIGAAKEIVEACARAALEDMGSSADGADFLVLGKRLRKEISQRAPASPTAKSARSLELMQLGFVNIEQALAELRNELGVGHGRRRNPTALSTRHAQLAIDIADTYVRFLVLTLQELKVI